MGNRGIVKPETFLRLPEVSANHIFEIVDADPCVRVEGIWIVHRDKPAGHGTMGEDAHFTQYDVFATLGNGRHLMMGDDPRMPKMPAQPSDTHIPRLMSATSERAISRQASRQ
jgi:hypothetical protein